MLNTFSQIQSRQHFQTVYKNRNQTIDETTDRILTIIDWLYIDDSSLDTCSWKTIDNTLVIFDFLWIRLVKSTSLRGLLSLYQNEVAESLTKHLTLTVSSFISGDWDLSQRKHLVNRWRSFGRLQQYRLDVTLSPDMTHPVTFFSSLPIILIYFYALILENIPDVFRIITCVFYGSEFLWWWVFFYVQ